MKNHTNVFWLITLIVMFAYNSAVFAGERTGSIVFEPVGAPAYEINSVSADSLVEAPAVLENMVQALSSGAWSNSAAGGSFQASCRFKF